jgi:hypothetical protein
MTRTSPLNLLLMAATLGLSALGCQSGGVGDPCIPEDEYRQGFNGYQVSEVNVESKSFQCETRVCIVNHFQGRVSCPYGQSGETPDIVDKQANGGANPSYKPPKDPARCRIPGTDGSHCLTSTMPGATQVDCDSAGNPPAGGVNIDEVTVPVDSQRVERNAGDTVYCSCRCKGPDASARYCECPSGYECSELVRELGIGAAQLAGSYCIKSGTAYVPQHPPGPQTCSMAAKDAVLLHKTTDATGKYTVKDVCGAFDSSGAGINP